MNDKLLYTYESKYTDGSLQVVCEVVRGLGQIGLTTVNPKGSTTISITPDEIDDIVLMLLQCKRRAVKMEGESNEEQTKLPWD